MSLNRMKALVDMNKHLNVLFEETPNPSREWELLNQAMTNLNDYAYLVAVSVEGPDTKKRHMAFWNIEQ